VLEDTIPGEIKQGSSRDTYSTVNRNSWGRRELLRALTLVAARLTVSVFGVTSIAAG
jgi:hypothetical protein